MFWPVQCAGTPGFSGSPVTVLCLIPSHLQGWDQSPEAPWGPRGENGRQAQNLRADPQPSVDCPPGVADVNSWA